MGAKVAHIFTDYMYGGFGLSSGQNTEQSLLSALKDRLEEGPNESEFKINLMINAQTVKGQDVVRFRLPLMYTDTDDLNSQYFEAKMEDFKKLLPD